MTSANRVLQSSYRLKAAARRRLRVAGAASVAMAALSGSASGQASPPPGQDSEAGRWEETHIDEFAGVRVVDFNRDVKPILASNCFVCHGFDPSTREAGLRLDIRDGATAFIRNQSRRVIEPGDPDRSELIARIESDDPEFNMPPQEHARLSDAEIETLRLWIEQGAQYDTHWSLQSLRDPEVPTVEDDSWARDSLDRFVLAKLEERGLHPAVEAARPDLLRRVYFDLIGLPPTPEEVRAFEHDQSPDAYETVVDRLLSSPRFGERWGRHWLDLMRYAETYGHEYDYPIHYPWQYRDYVIRALNADLPYDDFVREHIAGDLLDSPRRHPTDDYNESIIATGWWYLSQGKHAPVDVISEEADRIDNQIDVFSKTFLGLTVSCARCHDHKFDPIPQTDYYALSGFIQSSRRAVTYLDPRGEIASRAAELEPTKTAVDRLLVKSLAQDRSMISRTAPRFIAAAREVVAGEAKPTDPPVQQPFTVYDDFEDGDFDGWTVEGTAFGPAPYMQDTLAKYQGNVGAHGNGFVNTHNTRNGEDVRQADEHLGSMLSDAFTIDRPFIHFLIGGGNHAGKTCFNLLVDDKPARSATGTNSNRMHAAVWDVRDLVGRTARFQILDQERGGWGQIAVDFIVFADSVHLPPEFARPLDTIAREHRVDSNDLLKWLAALSDPELESEQHPLHNWRKATGAEALAEPAVADNSITFEDFGSGSYENWFIDGHAFGRAPTVAPTVRAASTDIVEPNVAHSGLLADQFQGTIRSREFTITKPYIHYRVKGRGGRVRLIIDEYHLDEFNALIFDGLIIDINHDDNLWHTHTQHIIDKYIGREAHFEIIDDGNGWIAVDEIRFADENRINQEPSPVHPPLVGDALARFGTGELTSQDAILLSWLLRYNLISQRESDQRTQFLARYNDIAHRIPAPMRVLSMQDGTPDDENLFIRGNHKMRGDEVPRRFLTELALENQNPIRSGSGRLELAERLLDEANPLPARVMVNRVWHHLVGRGLVPTNDDFGGLGKTPTHPELLDHLAHWFRNQADWSTKALIKRIVMSSTYRMASESSDQRAAEIDPNNDLLWKARVRRLEGEAIRDAILTISGRLNTQMYGEPVPLYLTPFLSGRGRPGASGPLDGDGRRSIYLAVRRNFLSPMMLAFDAPVPFTTIGRRSVSNVPAQALILMNDPFVHQQAERWAKSVLEDMLDATHADRINHLYMQAFAREPDDNERETARGYLETRIAESSPEVAYTELCHTLLNVKEFIFVK